MTKPKRSNLKRQGSSSSTTTEEKKSLEFGNVEIYEFRTIVGDNPEVSDGCPVALHPNGDRQVRVLHVSIYEKHRSKLKQKSKDKLRLSVYERAQRYVRGLDSRSWPISRIVRYRSLTLLSAHFYRLLDAGYSIHEIADGTLEALKTKQQRSDTNRSQRWDGVNAFVEYTGRGLRKMTLVVTQPMNPTKLQRVTTGASSA
jgi:hypothetical protein